MYHDDRVSFLITDSTSNKTPIANALIEVKYQGTTEWKCKTDNKGKAEYIIDIFRENHNSAVGSYQFFINGIQYGSIKEFKDGINEITLNQIANPTQEVDIAFLVDATGSMADEINFLKADLADILNKAQQQQTGVSLRTAFCMYRDIGDEYVTRSSDFTTTTQTSIDFIKAQEAKGGGDYPEALDSALSYTLNQLSWNSNAKARVLFVLLDAPPENNIEEVIIMQECLKKAAEKGVKIIPIAASGTDKSTEFLMRFLAIGTGGSYVFLTDDSGVGNSHEEPSIGNYQTEKLNDLLTRLISNHIQ
jgi:Mg-chelatase subunit ChlD